VHTSSLCKGQAGDCQHLSHSKQAFIQQAVGIVTKVFVCVREDTPSHEMHTCNTAVPAYADVTAALVCPTLLLYGNLYTVVQMSQAIR